MPEAEIDLSDSPELGSAFFKNATLRMPRAKTPVSLRLDQDVVEWYKQRGSGCQTRMNAVLRMYMQARTGTAMMVPSRRARNARKRAVSRSSRRPV